MAEGHFSPLPLSNGEFPIRRGKFIDIETFGLKATNIEAISGELLNLDILGNLTMGTGGVIRTASSGERLEITNTDNDRITWYHASGTSGFIGTNGAIPLQFSSTGGMTITDAESTAFGGVSTPLQILQTGLDSTLFAPITIRASAADATNAIVLDVAFAAGTVATRVVKRATGTSSLLVRDGAVALPGIAFIDDPDNGMYRAGPNQVALASGGQEVFRSTATATFLLQSYEDTTGNSVDVAFIGTIGRLGRSTSARKYKSRINYNMDWLADLELKPTKFYRKDDKRWFIGFIADDLGEQNKLIGIYADDEIENYDQRAVMAVMAAKINRLEKRLEELEK